MKCYHIDILMIIMGVILGGSLMLLAIISCALSGNCEGFTTEKATQDMKNFPEIVMVVYVVFFTSIAFLTFLLFYRRTLYVDDSLFILSIRGKREARKCKICGRHPFFQRYHAKKIHNLKITQLEDNFNDCGCDLCYQRKTDWKIGFKS